MSCPATTTQSDPMQYKRSIPTHTHTPVIKKHSKLHGSSQVIESQAESKKEKNVDLRAKIQSFPMTFLYPKYTLLSLYHARMSIIRLIPPSLNKGPCKTILLVGPHTQPIPDPRATKRKKKTGKMLRNNLSQKHLASSLLFRLPNCPKIKGKGERRPPLAMLCSRTTQERVKR